MSLSVMTLSVPIEFRRKKTVLLIATLDTKGTECLYLKDQLLSRNVDVLVLDCGLRGKAQGVKPDIPRGQVLRAAGLSYHDLQKLNRRESEEKMAQGVARVTAKLYHMGVIDGVLGVGGYDGTLLATAGMRQLPVGFPKIMLSAMACGNIRFGPYVGTKDISIMPSVFDVAGVNSLTRRIYDNAVGALWGMLETSREASSGSDQLVALSMFGQTTPCGLYGKKLLESNGYKVVAFHPNGVGGAAMEEIISSGVIKAVWDLTTQELSHEVVFNGPLARSGYLKNGLNDAIPRVLSTGCMDLIWGSSREADRFRRRKTLQYNQEVILGKLFAKEIKEVSRRFAQWINRLILKTRIAVILPLKGISMFDKKGSDFFDPELDRLLFDGLKKTIDPKVPVIEVDAHINDPIFAKQCVDVLLYILKTPGNRKRGGAHGQG